jgi:hypothetical protein
MTFVRIRFYLFLLLFLGWLSYLGYLVYFHRQPVVVSRAQWMHADVVAVVELPGGQVKETLVNAGAKLPETITIVDLEDATVKPAGPATGTFLVLLQSGGGTYKLAATTNNFTGKKPIYAWSKQVEAQAREYAK